MPSFADWYWTNIASRLALTITHNNRYPCVAPPAMFVAKLPGSTYATATTNAGPMTTAADRTRAGTVMPTISTPPSRELADRLLDEAEVRRAGGVEQRIGLRRGRLAPQRFWLHVVGELVHAVRCGARRPAALGARGPVGVVP